MQCNGESGKKENCNIFVASYEPKNNSWKDSKLFDYSNKEFSVGHPAITEDGLTMYFVSDMNGGQGGKDIWIIKKENGVWGVPVNAGPTINTIEDEMFPSVSADTTLYFSSNGLKGFGGLDIFSVKLIKGRISGTPENLNLPINSSADDFSIFYTSSNTGTFCSNRPGGKGDDDIYSFKLAPLKLVAIGNIVESMKLKPMAGVTVTMKGSDGSELIATTDKNGEYQFDNLKPNVTYTVTVSKKGYFGDKKTLATGNVKFSKEYSKKTGYDLDFGMLKLTKEEVEIPNIYYEFNKAEINPYSKKSLDQLAVMLKETPHVRLILGAHTDEKGSDEYNMKLSERRAKAVVDYLVSAGIESKRLEARGYGESQPLVKNAGTDEDHAKNRRTTFKVTDK
jgi:peptidoglycan-associated lipoprotein